MSRFEKAKRNYQRRKSFPFVQALLPGMETFANKHNAKRFQKFSFASILHSARFFLNCFLLRNPSGWVTDCKPLAATLEKVLMRIDIIYDSSRCFLRLDAIQEKAARTKCLSSIKNRIEPRRRKKSRFEYFVTDNFFNIDARATTECFLPEDLCGSCRAGKAEITS